MEASGSSGVQLKRARSVENSVDQIVMPEDLMTFEATFTAMPLVNACLLGSFVIGTKSAFANGYAFPYATMELDGQPGIFAFLCEKGSEHATVGEKLVILYDNEWFTAYDGRMTTTETGTLKVINLRQKVFRSKDHIWEKGWHKWQSNQNCSDEVIVVGEPQWSDGDWWVETRMAHEA